MGVIVQKKITPTVFKVLLFIMSTASYATTYYIDAVNGSDQKNGTSEATAWKSLAKASSITYSPGDHILFKRGCHYIGQFKPKGSGSLGNPIIVDTYGSGNKPILDGNGRHASTYDGVSEAVVALYNQEYWEINNLEVTNWGTVGDNDHLRTAIKVYFKESSVKTYHHIHVKNCYVHDIRTTQNRRDAWKYIFYSGGIIIGSAEGAAITLHDVLVENNTLYNCYGNGITIRTNTKYTNKNTIVRGNMLDIIGGDGINVNGSFKPLIEYNVAKDCKKYSNDVGVAMWIQESDGATFQYNEAYLTHTRQDGQGFNDDTGSKNSLYQYNYSHHNDGGFLLVMQDMSFGKQARNITVRYNIVNDEGPFFLYGGKNLHAYNNTFIVPDGSALKPKVVVYRGNGCDLLMQNNIFYGDISYPDDELGYSANNNLYYGSKETIVDTHPIEANPKFINSGNADNGRENAFHYYSLQSGSPAIDAGKTIPDNGGRDFQGNPITEKPDIGALEFVEVAKK